MGQSSVTKPPASEDRRSGRRQALLTLVATLVVVGLLAWQWWSMRHVEVQIVRDRLLMGTTCRLIAVGRRPVAEAALDRAWAELTAVDAAMSTYNGNSELSRWNAADANVAFPLSAATLEVLRASQAATADTEGAFDVTVLPLIRLWQEAARQQHLPTPEEIRTVKETTGAERFTVNMDSVIKQSAGVQVTLDGIAPGYAVQQAIEVLQTAGLRGGLIDLGGDIACFGRPRDAAAWQVAVQDPWSEGSLGQLPLQPRPGKVIAISTSGDYRRFVQIAGQRYSHILDPRTGYPAEQASSVTVIAEDAMTADIWATALSVLGTDEGTAMLDSRPSLAALFVRGDAEHPELLPTRRFPSFGKRGLTP